MNLEDREAMAKLFEDEQFESVVNLAAQAGVRYSIENPDAYVKSNLIGFFNILSISFSTNEENNQFFTDEEKFDKLMGESTGAAVIFGATGGVMEAALRTAYELVTGREVPFKNLDIK